MSQNFNSQKFTSLKKMKQQGTEVKAFSDFSTEITKPMPVEPTEYITENEPEPTAFMENKVEAFDQTEIIVDENLASELTSAPDNRIKLIEPKKKSLKVSNDENTRTPEEKKENAMFIWMMVMFFLAAPASVFLFVPAIIPFFLILQLSFWLYF